jgi:PKD repeat protein
MRGGTVGDPDWQIAADASQPPAFEQLVPGDAPPAIASTNVDVSGRTARLRVDAGAGIRDAWWSFGDLSGARGQDVSHTYLQPGQYHVNVWVANASGTTAQRELPVTIP